MKKKELNKYGLDELLEELGYSDEMDYLNEYGFDSINPGICTECGTVHDRCEPDLIKGWCENCGLNKVKSGLFLIGIV